MWQIKKQIKILCKPRKQHAIFVDWAWLFKSFLQTWRRRILYFIHPRKRNSTGCLAFLGELSIPIFGWTTDKFLPSSLNQFLYCCRIETKSFFLRLMLNYFSVVVFWKHRPNQLKLCVSIPSSPGGGFADQFCNLIEIALTKHTDLVVFLGFQL